MFHVERLNVRLINYVKWQIKVYFQEQIIGLVVDSVEQLFLNIEQI